MPILYIKDEHGNFVEVPALKGSPGKTPVRGVDYWTEADKEQIVGEVLGEVEAPDMDDYYTKTETDAKIQAAVGSGGGSTGGGGTSGSASGYGNWELIERITLEEETSTVARTKEPSGTGYNFIAVTVAVQTSNASTSTGNLSLVTSCQKQYKKIKEAYVTGAVAANKTMYTTWQVDGRSGIFEMTVTTPSEIATLWPDTLRKDPIMTEVGGMVIDRVNLSGSKMPVGTTIEIWGVRA